MADVPRNIPNNIAIYVSLIKKSLAMRKNAWTISRKQLQRYIILPTYIQKIATKAYIYQLVIIRLHVNKFLSYHELAFVTIKERNSFIKFPFAMSFVRGQNEPSE